MDLAFALFLILFGGPPALMLAAAMRILNLRKKPHYRRIYPIKTKGGTEFRTKLAANEVSVCVTEAFFQTYTSKPKKPVGPKRPHQWTKPIPARMTHCYVMTRDDVAKVQDKARKIVANSPLQT